MQRLFLPKERTCSRPTATRYGDMMEESVPGIMERAWLLKEDRGDKAIR